MRACSCGLRARARVRIPDPRAARIGDQLLHDRPDQGPLERVVGEAEREADRLDREARLRAEMAVLADRRMEERRALPVQRDLEREDGRPAVTGC